MPLQNVWHLQRLMDIFKHTLLLLHKLWKNVWGTLVVGTFVAFRVNLTKQLPKNSVCAGNGKYINLLLIVVYFFYLLLSVNPRVLYYTQLGQCSITCTG